MNALTRPLPLRRVTSAISSLAAGLLLAGAVAATPEPTDFGYGHLAMWDGPAVGTRSSALAADARFRSRALRCQRVTPL